MMQPWSFIDFSEEEQKMAEQMLIAALEKRLDKRWLYGLEKLATEEAGEFLLKLFNRHKSVAKKLRIAKSLLRIDNHAPVLEFLHEVLTSDRPGGLRIEVLYAVSWLKEVYFKDKTRAQLLLSIFYDGLVDKNERIRKYAYELLLEHYHLNEFTPLDDSIMKIITKKRNKDGYREAVELFHERAEALQVHPFSAELVVQHIRDLPNNPPVLEITECEICREIPEKSEADLIEEESLASYTSQLETTVIFAYYQGSIKRCPICGRLYKYQYHYEYFACSENDEDEMLSRIDTKGAIEYAHSFINFYDFKRIIKCGIFMKISY